MPQDRESIDAQLAAVRQGFIDQLPKRMESILLARDAWQSSGANAELDEFHRLIHSLTGSGATFGLEQISRDSRALEQFLKSLRDETAPTQDHFDEADRLLHIIAAQATTSGDSEKPPPAPETIPTNGNENKKTEYIYILDSDHAYGQALLGQLNNFGYQTCLYTSPGELIQAIEKQRPSAILAEVTLNEDEHAGLRCISHIQARQLSNIPVIFLSRHNDFSARLAAVRAGGDAFFTKPLAIETLVDAVDEIIHHSEQESARILIVDDISEQAELNALILRQEGMTARVETNPMQVVQAIDEFQPELILMDMHMPECDGTELAAVIRQRPEYVGIPIIFLSSENNREMQLQALRRGGDEFLNKAMEPWALAESVAIRAERYRILRSFMTRDSLTGLLNHSSIIDNLDREVSRYARYGNQLSFAMIDIDHFKKVNDTYGHGAGDSVIKNLARLLQQRLRKTDIIGRYGGEEFAIIMPETPLKNAILVMDEIRQRFAQMTHHTGEQRFQVSISGGISTSLPSLSATDLREQADQRLYQAKNTGRNRVIGNSNSH